MRSEAILRMLLTAWISCLSAAFPSAVGQVTAPPAEHEPAVTLTDLSPPYYPPLARQARISGDVNLRLLIRSDGSVESVTLVSGDPMLVTAAVESAQQSHFQCRVCNETNIVHSMTYTFSVVGDIDPCCCTEKPLALRGSTAEQHLAPQVSHTQNHITLIAAPFCVCPDECAAAWAKAHSRFRSVKCLYLWKCGRRQISIQ